MNVWVLDPAHITPYYDEALCRSLADHGHQVRFVTCEFIHDDSIKHPEHVTTDFHYFNRFAGLTKTKFNPLRRAARFFSYGPDTSALIAKADMQKPDIAHLQWSRVPNQDYRLVKELQRRGIKVIHTIHDVEPLYSRAGGKSALERVWSACDGLVVHTKLNYDELLTKYPSIQRDRVAIIPHGPLQSETAPADASQARARQSLKLPDDAPIALFFGVIKPYKALDVLIAAWPTVLAKVPNARLLVAGKAGPAEKQMIDDARAKGATIDAQLGFIPNSDVWKYYLASDVSVLPYRSITQSGVLLSSFAFGRTAVVTRVGGLPELIEPIGFGWVVPSESPSELATAVIESLQDRQATLAKGAATKAFVDQELSWTKIADLTTALYQRVTAN